MTSRSARTSVVVIVYLFGGAMGTAVSWYSVRNYIDLFLANTLLFLPQHISRSQRNTYLEGLLKLLSVDRLSPFSCFFLLFEFSRIYVIVADQYTEKIMMSSMSGDNLRDLISNNLFKPTALTVDFNMNNRLFWANSHIGQIESCAPDGSNRLSHLPSDGISRGQSVGRSPQT